MSTRKVKVVKSGSNSNSEAEFKSCTAWSLASTQQISHMMRYEVCFKNV